ncbi:hypothetical protein ACVWWN_005959 [Mycobacterium sp. URHB0021]|jgi:hypothetical protein
MSSQVTDITRRSQRIYRLARRAGQRYRNRESHLPIHIVDLPAFTTQVVSASLHMVAASRPANIGTACIADECLLDLVDETFADQDLSDQRKHLHSSLQSAGG